MILKGSQRAGGLQLANHLMNEIDNDHVTLHELRGFVSEDLHGAMKEAYAISRGTKRCRQFLFSLSLNPPQQEQVSINAFEKAISQVEDRLGLTNQPRAIVFHEKEARRHCHAVWLRVDTSRMRAINLPYFKSRLRDQSRELFQEHGWHMPKGLQDKKDRDLLNYSLVESQQSKRTKRDPKVTKAIFQECWQHSDSLESFQAALEQYGFCLAKGNRRGHVAVDYEGNVYAISRWVGIRAKEVRERLGRLDKLMSVNQARSDIVQKMDSRLMEEQATAQAAAEEEFSTRVQTMRKAQRVARKAQARAHELQRRKLNSHHATQLPKGLKALWFRVTGRYSQIKQQIEEAAQKQAQDHAREKEKLIHRQLLERWELQRERRQQRHWQTCHLAEIRSIFSRESHSTTRPNYNARGPRRLR